MSATAMLLAEVLGGDTSDVTIVSDNCLGHRTHKPTRKVAKSRSKKQLVRRSSSSKDSPKLRKLATAATDSSSSQQQQDGDSASSQPQNASSTSSLDLREDAALHKATQRRRAFHWYTRLGLPDRATMRVLLQKMGPSCDISGADVDLLPWDTDGKHLSETKKKKSKTSLSSSSSATEGEPSTASSRWGDCQSPMRLSKVSPQVHGKSTAGDTAPTLKQRDMAPVPMKRMPSPGGLFGTSPAKQAISSPMRIKANLRLPLETM